ncbi:MAG: L,D-transpeptidase family protein [Pseudomonadota bacterium]|nr:L,D-transpeptidase family protein [Pseudomonadota bacterium]
MNKLALALAVTGAFALSVPTAPATASLETYEAKAAASDAAAMARADLAATFGKSRVKPGQFLWRNVPGSAGNERVVVGLSDQQAYLYRGSELVAAAAISTGTSKNPTPTGIFQVLEKKTMHFSRKYDNAPMPFMQRIDRFGIALHAGHNPGRPASHGCIRLPKQFAEKLFSTTGVGTPVMIGA